MYLSPYLQLIIDNIKCLVSLFRFLIKLELISAVLSWKLICISFPSRERIWNLINNKGGCQPKGRYLSEIDNCKAILILSKLILIRNPIFHHAPCQWARPDQLHQTGSVRPLSVWPSLVCCLHIFASHDQGRPPFPWVWPDAKRTLPCTAVLERTQTRRDGGWSAVWRLQSISDVKRREEESLEQRRAVRPPSHCSHIQSVRTGQSQSGDFTNTTVGTQAHTVTNWVAGQVPSLLLQSHCHQPNR